MAAEGGLSGCDYAGTVVKVGSNVTKRFKEGDRVAGVAHGANFSNANDGVFAEYAVVKGDLQVHIPASLTFESAATFPLGVSTLTSRLLLAILNSLSGLDRQSRSVSESPRPEVAH
jgi:NADPH:quinone reductase-like Zn-dependent oxidoreductase